MKKILVMCTGNSCRSQMAEGYLRHFVQGRAEVYSAGVLSTFVNPLAIQVMAEDEIDISHHTSNRFDDYEHIPFDIVVTVCDHAKESCPVFPGQAKKYHHNFFDPSHVEGPNEERLALFRRTRNEIRAYCKNLVRENFS